MSTIKWSDLNSFKRTGILKTSKHSYMSSVSIHCFISYTCQLLANSKTLSVNKNQCSYLVIINGTKLIIFENRMVTE